MKPSKFRFVLAATTIFSYYSLSPAFAMLPSFESIKANYTASDRMVFDRNGEPLQRIRINDQVRRGVWTSFDQLSPALIDAVLLSEDQRFFDHGGVDWFASASAAVSNLRIGKAVRGASSISMQVAAGFDESLKRTSNGRNIEQKYQQAQAAWELERHRTKQQILEIYLNQIYFRGELQGIAAASEQLFGKAPHGLNAVESALLAALIRGPQAGRAIVEQRACELLRQQNRGSDCPQLAYAVDRWNSVAALRGDSEVLAPHAIRYLPAAAQRISIDRRMQIAARTAIAQHLQVLSTQNAQDTAVVVIDNKSGEILAYVGSSGRLSKASEVDAARAPRQAGSTLKPFIYGLGLERNLFTAASLLDDSPFSVDVGGGLYAPQNYTNHYVGPVSVRTALASSLNIPAIRALDLVGIEAAHQLLRRAHLTTLVNDADHYGFSLALGSADVTLLDLTNAYRAIANGGVWQDIRLTLALDTSANKPRPKVRLFSEATAWLLSDILSDRGARYLTFGMDNPLALSHWAAVKTGTSKDMRDNWTIGFNTQVTVGVWVGNASGQPMQNVSGVSGAGPIWAEVMETVHAHYGSNAKPKPPAQLIKQRIQFAHKVDIDRNEWFIRGTEPQQTIVAAREGNAVGARIVTPTNGIIVALDPDIPAQHQRISLKSGDTKQARCWIINNEDLGCSENPMHWTPEVGSATIRLLDMTGQERDRIALTVRGFTRKSIAPKKID